MRRKVAATLICTLSMSPCFCKASKSAEIQQNSSLPADTSKKPTIHFFGTITAIAMDAGSITHVVTVKADNGTTYSVDVTYTKTILKVARRAGATDLKTAVRITADRLVIAENVDVRGTGIGEGTNAMPRGA